MSLERIAVVGTTGSGKSTFARRAARLLGSPHIELDELHWRPGWQHASTEELRASLEPLLSGPAWVVDGNYHTVRDQIWSRATAVVWLKYPFLLSFSRLLRRSLRRLRSRELVCNGNRENFRNLFCSRDSLFLWAITSHPRYLRSYPEAIARHSHLESYVFTRPSQSARFLSLIQDTAAAEGESPCSV